MLYSIIKEAVIQRFSDEAISVREAAVSLVGTYVVHTPANANKFHSAFLTGLNDSGVSVRKRTVKILQDILTSNPDYKGRSAVCSEMLRLAADRKEDDSVRDLIHDLFRKLWLENGEEHVAKETSSPVMSPASDEMLSPSSCVMDVEERPTDGAGGGIVTPTPPARETPSTTPANSTRSAAKKKRNAQLRTRSEVASEQMVEVVKAADTGDNLTKLLLSLLANVNDADKEKPAYERKRGKLITENHCAMLVDALFERLLKVEDERTDHGGEIGKELVAIFLTIKVFTDVSPTVVLSHLDTLLPYLKGDNGVQDEDNAAIIGSICDIISQFSVAFDKDQVEKVGAGSLGEDLIQITYKFGPDAASSAVRTLCVLAHRDGSPEESPFGVKMIALARTFHTLLLKFENEEDFSTMRVGTSR